MDLAQEMYEKQEQGKRKRQKTQDNSKHSRNERWFDCNVIITIYNSINTISTFNYHYNYMCGSRMMSLCIIIMSYIDWPVS